MLSRASRELLCMTFSFPPSPPSANDESCPRSVYVNARRTPKPNDGKSLFSNDMNVHWFPQSAHIRALTLTGHGTCHERGDSAEG